MATTKARTHQAVTSPIAAQRVADCPRLVLKRLRSFRILTSTGKAVMLMEVPIKSAKGTNDVPAYGIAAVEQEGEQHAGEKGHQDAGMTDDQIAVRAVPELPQIELHPDGEHEKANPDLAEKPQRFKGRGSENELESPWSEEPEERWAEQNAGHHLPDHGWLAEPGKDPTEGGRCAEDDPELDEEAAKGAGGVVPEPRCEVASGGCSRLGKVRFFLSDGLRRETCRLEVSPGVKGKENPKPDQTNHDDIKPCRFLDCRKIVFWHVHRGCESVVDLRVIIGRHPGFAKTRLALGSPLIL